MCLEINIRLPSECSDESSDTQLHILIKDVTFKDLKYRNFLSSHMNMSLLSYESQLDGHSILLFFDILRSIFYVFL